VNPRTSAAEPFNSSESSAPGGGPVEAPMPMLVRSAPAPARVFGFNLRWGPQAVSEARHALAATAATLREEERQSVLLLLSELVTNAVRHGMPGTMRGVAVKVVEADERVGAAVTSPGDPFDWSGRRSDDPLEPGGYGLVLVDSMASRWGIDHAAGATTVWFELDRPGA
jgi:anti-sigma regulatory factor (Ser/Thr protein kinase)